MRRSPGTGRARWAGRGRRLRAVPRARAGLAALVLAAGPGAALPAIAHAAKKKHSPASSTSATSTTTNALGGALTAPPVNTTAATAPATTVATSPGTSTSGSGISPGSAIGIAAAAAAIIVGIGVAIMRDARRRTRNRHMPAGPTERIPGSKRPPKARKLSPAERRRRKRGRSPRRR